MAISPISIPISAKVCRSFRGMCRRSLPPGSTGYRKEEISQDLDLSNCKSDSGSQGTPPRIRPRQSSRCGASGLSRSRHDPHDDRQPLDRRRDFAAWLTLSGVRRPSALLLPCLLHRRPAGGLVPRPSARDCIAGKAHRRNRPPPSPRGRPRSRRHYRFRAQPSTHRYADRQPHAERTIEIRIRVDEIEGLLVFLVGHRSSGLLRFQQMTLCVAAFKPRRVNETRITKNHGLE